MDYRYVYLAVALALTLVLGTILVGAHLLGWALVGVSLGVLALVAVCAAATLAVPAAYVAIALYHVLRTDPVAPSVSYSLDQGRDAGEGPERRGSEVAAMIASDSRELSFWMLFAKLGLTPIQARDLLSVFGGPRGVFQASRGELVAAARGAPRLHGKVREVERSTDLADMLRLLSEANARVVTLDDADYPSLLRDIHAPPPVLFAVGDIECLSAPCVAIVGSRSAGSYGKRIAEGIGSGLARAGITVLSGHAVGVDAAAHSGALEGGGKTGAVLGCSVDVWYPKQNRALREAIQESGVVLSEFAPTAEPRPWAFPQRNRIVSGLCQATVVVEAPERSGALITADLALEQGREVMAVPGSVHSGQSRGCHMLLRDGATVVESAEDVLAALGLPKVTPARPGPARSDLSPPEQRVMSALDREGTLVETITQATGLPVEQVSSTLMLLEMKGCAQRLPGGRYASA